MSGKLISVIAPCFNEEKNVAALHARLSSVFAHAQDSLEIVFVDDGSSDCTSAEIEKISTHDGRVRLVQFARNFGKEAALTAGLDHASGDAVVFIDADLQHPPEFIHQMIAAWRDGAEVVYGVRQNRDGDGLARRTFTFFFYGLLNTFGEIRIPPNAGDYRLLDRKAADALRALPERNRFMKGLYAWVGFRTLALPLKVEDREVGQSRFSFAKLAEFGLGGITAFSNIPLRLAGFVGLAVAIAALLYGLFEIVSAVLLDRQTPGFATLVVAIMFFGGVQMMFLGIIGEYVGRIYTEVKGRPVYIVRRKSGFDA